MAIEEARREGHSLSLIDDCLCIGCYFSPDPIYHQCFVGAAWATFSNSEEPDAAFLEELDKDMITYRQAASHPLAMPAFLHGIDDQSVADLLSSRMMIRFSFSWDAFAELLKEYGCELSWTKKPVDCFPILLARGIPTVSKGGATYYIGQPLYMRLFSDFINPRCWANQLATSLDLLLDRVAMEASQSKPTDLKE